MNSASGIARPGKQLGPLSRQAAIFFRVLDREKFAFAILEVDGAVIADAG